MTIVEFFDKYARGGDMGITMITNAADLTDLEIARKLRNLTM